MSFSPILMVLLTLGRMSEGWQPDRLRFGAMLEYDKKEVHSALKFQSHYLNRDEESLKLVSSLNYTNMNNAYYVIITMCSKLQDQVYALVGTTRMNTINTMKSYTQTYKLPLVSTGMAVKRPGQEYAYIVYMRPLYAQALYDIIEFKKWTRIRYVYNSLEGLHRMEQLRDIIVSRGMHIETPIRHVADGVEASQVFQDLYTSDINAYHHIALDMPAVEVKRLLEIAKTKDWLTRFHYLLVEPDIDDIDWSSAFPEGGVNVTGVRLVDPLSHHVSAYMPHWKSADLHEFPKAGTEHISYEAALAIDTVTLIQKALKKWRDYNPKQFRESNGSTINCKKPDDNIFTDGYKIKEAMHDITFTGLTGFVSFDQFGLRQNYTLNIMEVSRKASYSLIATWRDGIVLNTDIPSVTPPSAPVSKNKTYIITTIKSAPFLMERVPERPGQVLRGNERYEGFSVELASLVAEQEHFDFEIRLVKDGKYGAREENGSWNGMVGELIRHEADLCVAPLTITAERETVIDFSKPFMGLGISIMLKKPKAIVPDVFSFLQPFSYEIWTCIVFGLLGVSAVMYLVSKFSATEYSVEEDDDGPVVENGFSIFNSIWFSLGSFLGQGGDVEPRSLGSRIGASLWWFFTLIIISSYTANLAAFLTASRMQSPIASAEDLAKQTKIKYGSVESGSTTNFFRMSSISLYERMWSFMQTAEPSVFVDSNEEGIQRVRESDGRYAFLAESTTIEYNNQQLPCDTVKIGNNLDSKGYGIGTPIGSHLRKLLNVRVLKLRESGVLRSLEEKWWYEKGQCGGSPHGSKKPVATNALEWAGVRGVFYILFSGLVLGMLCSAGELLYESNKEAKKSQIPFLEAAIARARLSFKGYPKTRKENSTSGESTAEEEEKQLDNYKQSSWENKYGKSNAGESYDDFADEKGHTQV